MKTLNNQSCIVPKVNVSSTAACSGCEGEWWCCLQDVVTTGEVVVVLGARSVLRTKGGEVQTVSSTCELELVWQVIALAVPEASGVPTLKDHLSFLVSAGFTG